MVRIIWIGMIPDIQARRRSGTCYGEVKMAGVELAPRRKGCFISKRRDGDRRFVKCGYESDTISARQGSRKIDTTQKARQPAADVALLASHTLDFSLQYWVVVSAPKVSGGLNRVGGEAGALLDSLSSTPKPGPQKAELDEI